MPNLAFLRLGTGRVTAVVTVAAGLAMALSQLPEGHRADPSDPSLATTRHAVTSPGGDTYLSVVHDDDRLRVRIVSADGRREYLDPVGLPAGKRYEVRWDDDGGRVVARSDGAPPAVFEPEGRTWLRMDAEQLAAVR